MKVTVIDETFVVEGELTIKDLSELCEHCSIKFNCKPTVIASTKRLANLLKDDCKWYRLTTEEDKYKAPSIIHLEKFTIIETKNESDFIYIVKVA